MALNIGQAGDVNTVIRHLTGDTSATRGEAIEALARLAEAAYRPLRAGLDSASARKVLEQRWPLPAPLEQSPTDPAELGAWLRALPFGTILRSDSGNAWQVHAGIESGAGDEREFPALISPLAPEVFEISEGHAGLDTLAYLAPFTVLALGEASPGAEESD